MTRALILCALLTLAAPAAAQDELSLTVGAGRGVDAFGGTGPDVRSGMASLQAARDLGGGWDLLLEAQLLVNRRPAPGRYAAVVLGARRDLPGPAWLRPYLSAGAGVGVLDAAGLAQANGLNFALQAALGARLPWKVNAELRLHHVSNARLRQPNPGLNAVLFLVGPRWDW